MSEQDTNTDRRMVVTVDWTGEINMLEGLKLPFCVPNTFCAQGSIEFDGSATGRFEGMLWMVVLQSNIHEAIAHFGVRSVRVGIEDTPAPEPFALEDGTDADAERNALWKKLDIEVETLNLPLRALNALKNDNMKYIGDIFKKSERELLRTPNFKEKSLNALKEAIGKHGITFGMDIMGWLPPTDPSRTGKA